MATMVFKCGQKHTQTNKKYKPEYLDTLRMFLSKDTILPIRNMVIVYSELSSYITICNIIIFIRTLRLPCLQRTETNVESTCVCIFAFKTCTYRKHVTCIFCLIQTKNIRYISRHLTQHVFTYMHTPFTYYDSRV